MFIAIGFIVSTVISLASSFLLGQLSKPKTKDPESQVSPTGRGQSIPFCFNEYKFQGKIVQYDDFQIDRDDDEIWAWYTAICCGTEGLGVELRGMQLNSKKVIDYRVEDNPDVDQSDVDKVLAKSYDFEARYIQWKDGKEKQFPPAYWEAVLGFNNANAYREKSHATFVKLKLNDFSTNTFAIPDFIVRTYETYAAGSLIKTISRWAGIPESEVETSEIDEIEIGGFASERDGNTFWSDIEEILTMYFLYPVELPDGATSYRTLRRPESEAALEIPISDLGVRIESTEYQNLIRTEYTDPRDLPQKIALIFYDKDDQIEQETVYSDPHPDATTQYIEKYTTRFSISKSEAKIIANKLLHQIWIRRKKHFFILPFEYKSEAIPGRVCLLPYGKNVQIIEVNTGANLLLECQAYDYDTNSINYDASTAATSVNSTATVDSDLTDYPLYDPNNPGQQVIDVDYAVLDIPTARETHGEIILYALCARGNTDLLISTDGGTNYDSKISFTSASTFGNCNTILGAVENINLEAANLPIFDDTNTLNITLVSGSLSELNNNQIDNQEQLLFIGKFEFGEWHGEYVIATSIADLGNGQYELSNLIRGLRGTEDFIHLHVSGESIFLINDSTPRISLTTADLGKTLFFKPQIDPLQDIETTPSTSIDFIGKSLKPYPPTDVEFSSDADGNLVFNLSPRYRWNYRQGESSETYEIDLLDITSNLVRTITGKTPVYKAGDIATDALGPDLDFNAYKISSLVGRSNPSYWLNRQSGGISQTVNNNDDSSFAGFKNVTGDYTLVADDKGYWIIINPNGSNSNLTLPNALGIEGFRCIVQNGGANNYINLVSPGTINTTTTFLTPGQTIDLADKNGIWYAHPGLRESFSLDLTHDTATLAQGAAEDFDLTVLVSTPLITTITLSVPGRLRIYLTAAERTADTADVTTDVSSDEVIDLLFTSGNLTKNFISGKAIATEGKILFCRLFNDYGGDTAVSASISLRLD